MIDGRHLFLFFLISILLFHGAFLSAAEETSAVRIVATIFPLADISKEITGVISDVRTLLPPNICVHDYSPTPADIEAVAKADILVMIGPGIDGWVERAIKASGNERLQKIALIHELRLSSKSIQASHARSHEKRELFHEPPPATDVAAIEPHVWLDPAYTAIFARHLSEKLSAIYPGHRAELAEKLDSFLSRLEMLDGIYRDTLTRAKRKKFLVYHGAFSHIARRYSLEQIAILPEHSMEITPGRLEAAIRIIKSDNLPAVFVQPGFPREKLAPLVRETGIRIIALDPVGGKGKKGYDSYFAMMISNLKLLASGLEAPPPSEETINKLLVSPSGR